MRVSALLVGALAILTPLSAAWMKEDREIFRVRDELLAHEGAGVNFYEFLGVSPTASLDDINKAYRKKSRLLHPDKIKQQLQAERAQQAKQKSKEKGGKKPGTTASKAPSASEIKAAIKRASERQARLSIVTNVLRGPGRDRYDHFLSNGFPTWKGTEYYYSRYRPGLGTVLFGVFVAAGGGAHYMALYMGWRRQREFVERYIKFARHAAWGENMNIPGLDGAGTPAAAAAPAAAAMDDDRRMMPTNRKMRRMQERESKKEASKGTTNARLAKKGGRRSGLAVADTALSQSPSEGSGPTGAKKRVLAENGKVLIVDSLGDVYLEQEDEDGKVAEFLLDPNELHRPTVSDTAVVRLSVWLFRSTLGRVLSKPTDDDEEDEEYEEVTEANDDESSEPGKRTPSTDSAEDFELLEKATDEPEKDKAQATGNSPKLGKANKRKGKKR